MIYKNKLLLFTSNNMKYEINSNSDRNPDCSLKSVLYLHQNLILFFSFFVSISLKDLNLKLSIKSSLNFLSK